MNGHIKKLKDTSGNYIYPVVVEDSIYMNDESTKLSTKLGNIDSQLADIVTVSSNNTIAEINNKIASLTTGGTVVFKKGTYTGDIILNVPNVSLRGEEALINGHIKVGDGTTDRVYYYASISGFRFVGGTDQTSILDYGIQVKNARRLTIRNNMFAYVDKAINFVNSGSPKAHSCEGIEIIANTTHYVNYSLYIDKCTTVVEGITLDWMNIADITFSENITLSRKCTVNLVCGIDGLKVNNNIFYMTPYNDTGNRSLKTNHVYIGDLNNSVTISNNALFESGEESIKLVNPTFVNIIGNNFYWCGEKGVYSAIHFTTPLYGIGRAVITGNAFERFSNHVLEIDSTLVYFVDITGNNIRYNNNDGSNFASYFGSTDLSTFDHYIVYAPSSCMSANIKEDNVINQNEVQNIKNVSVGGVSVKVSKQLRYQGNTFLEKSITTNGSNAVNIASLRNNNMNSVYNAVYGAMVLVNARSGIYGTNENALYLLLINKSATSVAPTVTLLHSVGLTTGAGANFPSFTFSVVADTGSSYGQLACTPIGSTSGTFYFNIQSFGDLVFGA